MSDELKALIFAAFQDGTLHTKDWHNVSLTSLRDKKRPLPARASMPGPPPGPPPAPRAPPGVGGAWSVPPPGVPPRPPSTPPAPSRGRTSKKTKKAHTPAVSLNEDPHRKAMRLRRFEDEQAAFQREQEEDVHAAMATTHLGSRLGLHPPPTADPNVIDWDEYTVVGTSTKLEKPYLRLTSAPDPKTVRPLATLRSTFALLQDKWRADKNYAYICDQFKSMRQDLTVQRIKNEFTVEVYETHARIALEKGDLGEYNQCQTQLRGLYAHGIPGSTVEFLAYRILYLLHTRNQREVNNLMAELTPADKQQTPVAHALDVRKAMRTGNYHRFFALYKHTPNMNAYIMDHFVERERVHALLVLARSIRPSCPLPFLASELGWASVAELDTALRGLGAAMYTDKGPLDTAHWDTKRAVDALLHATERHRKVDLKGQL